MLLKDLKYKNSGNVTFLSLALLAVFSFLFIVIFDACQIFIAREETKKASDAASLAVAQNLLFFEIPECYKIAEEVAKLNNCFLVECSCVYDEVVVTAGKKIRFIFLDKFIKKGDTATSTSTSKVVYPWDEQLGYCDSYRFSY